MVVIWKDCQQANAGCPANHHSCIVGTIKPVRLRLIGHFKRTGENEVFRNLKRCQLRIVTRWVIILKWRQEKRILEVDVDSDKFQWGTFVTTVISHAARVGRGEVYTGFWW